MASAQATVLIPLGREEALDLCRKALASSGIGAEIKTTNPATFTIEAATGTSLVSWSEEISIRVEPQAGQESSATVRSESWQLVDWGKNQKNVDAVVRRIRQLVAARA